MKNLVNSTLQLSLLNATMELVFSDNYFPMAYANSSTNSIYDSHHPKSAGTIIVTCIATAIGMAVIACLVVGPLILCNRIITTANESNRFNEVEIFAAFATTLTCLPLVMISILGCTVLLGNEGDQLIENTFRFNPAFYVFLFLFSPLFLYYYPEESRENIKALGNCLLLACIGPFLLLWHGANACAKSEILEQARGVLVGVLSDCALLFECCFNHLSPQPTTEQSNKSLPDIESGTAQKNPIAAYAVNPTITSNFQTISENDLKITDDFLGRGKFGIVFKGRWKMTDVAVKQMYTPGVLISEMIRNELEVHGKLRHTNIVSLFGVCYMKANVSLIMEYMSQGSLYDVFNVQKKKLDWSVRLKIARDIAVGVNFLHTSNPQVIHRDLKSLNILLDNQMCAKLADFGLAEFKKVSTSVVTAQPQTQTSVVGTFPWMAPELFGMGARHTEFSDMYALGIILHEICTQNNPFANMDNATVDNIKEWAKNGDRQTIPTDTPKKFAHLITKCWAVLAVNRPKALYVAQELEKLCPIDKTGSNVQWSQI